MLRTLFRSRTDPAGLSIIFVLDLPGIDEWAIPLLCSLKLYAPKNATLIAYVPDWKWPLFTATVKTLLRELGAEVRLFRADAGNKLFASKYPNGNKIVACTQKRRARRTVFLDTDMFLNAPLDADALFGGCQAAVCPAEFNTFSNRPEDWGPVYGMFGLDLPERNLPAKRSRTMMYPYFNGGLVAFDETTGLARSWADTASRIDHSDLDIKKRPWLDQVALPVAMARKQVSYRILEEAWNYGLNGPGGGRELPGGVLIAHWHWVPYLMFPGTHARVLEIIGAVLGPTTLHDIAARALRERSAVLSQLPFGDRTRDQRAILERAQKVSEKRRDQLVGF